MKRNRKTAAVLSAIVLLLAFAASLIVFAFLPFASERLALTVGCLILGVISALLLHAVVTRLPDKLSTRVTGVLLFALFVSVPMASAAMPRITYSRFGFTVYGAMPIPVLDITVNQHGMLWFRPKTHQVTRAELEALIAPGVEVVVVGIGWDSIAQLADAAKQLGDSVDLRVLPTPKAFAVYNALKAKGCNVVLLAHSTC
jgi:hypothetical protein